MFEVLHQFKFRFQSQVQFSFPILSQYPSGLLGHQMEKDPFVLRILLQGVSPTLWGNLVLPFLSMHFFPITSPDSIHPVGLLSPLEIPVRFHFKIWGIFNPSPFQGHCSVIKAPPHIQQLVTFSIFTMFCIKPTNKFLSMVHNSSCSY